MTARRSSKSVRARVRRRSAREFHSGEPIRLLHHFACTGGTLFAKCLSSMSRVQLLSEVDPLSTALDNADGNRFAPTDVVTLMRQSTRGATSALIIELFLNNLEVIHANCRDSGQRLIVRDHPHSHFCMGEAIPRRPSLRAIVSSRFRTLSAITVRHPLDSFLSLEANGWNSFTPFTLDEYSKRYRAFLRAYAGVPRFKYEDFVDSPQGVMRSLSSCLGIPYSESFERSFGAIRLTGDSGRTGATIQRRPRRAVSARLQRAITHSRNYRLLRDTLQYDE